MKFYLLLLTIFITTISCVNLKTKEPGGLVPLTADKDSSLPQITLNNCTFHLQTYGNPENPVIIFLPGGLADSRPFINFTKNYNGKKLTDNYFLVLWDMRGKGLSQRFDKLNISFEIYLKDIEAVVNYYSKDRKVILIGHSFGGTFSTMYMNKHPDKIAGTVLLESGAFSSKQVTRESDLNLTNEWINDLMWCQQIINPSNHYLADFNFAAAKCQQIQPEMHTTVKTPFWRVGVAAQHWLGSEYVRSDFNFTKNLKLIKSQVLIIAGSKTERLGIEYQKEKLKFFKSTRFEVIEDAGHGDIIWSKTNIVVPLILEYLESLNLKG